MDEFGNKHYEQASSIWMKTLLRKLPMMTGGEYFRAADTESLARIYTQIDKLEKTKIEEKGYRQYEPLFGYFVIAALLLCSIEIILVNTLFLKIP